jgi:hypothetical protein
MNNFSHAKLVPHDQGGLTARAHPVRAGRDVQRLVTDAL